MEGTRMVPLTAVGSEFAGRVLVAKLGSAGLLAELRGVSRIYPTVLGQPVVYVEAGELSEARELIAAQVEEDGFAADLGDVAAPADVPGRPTRGGRRPGRLLRPLLVIVALILLASLSVGTRSCSAAGATTTGRHN